jgi:hypothetical protein
MHFSLAHGPEARTFTAVAVAGTPFSHARRVWGTSNSRRWPLSAK